MPEVLRKAIVGCLIALGSGLFGQSPSTAPSTDSDTAASRPITEAQLRSYLEKSMLLDASKQHIQDGLAQTRKTLPPWVPDDVWQDVTHQVESLDYVKLLLPVYQRYFTVQDGVAMSLLFDGPTGHAYAQAALDSRLPAIHQGLEGAAAEQAAMNSDADLKVQELRRKRIAELTPEQLAEVRGLQASKRTTVDGLKLDDEQNVVVVKKVNEVFHATLAAHNRELQAAQQAYEAKHR